MAEKVRTATRGMCSASEHEQFKISRVLCGAGKFSASRKDYGMLVQSVGVVTLLLKIPHSNA